MEAQLEGFEAAVSSEQAAAAEDVDVEAAAEIAAETEAAAEAGSAETPAEAPPSFSIPGIGDKTMRKLIEAGFDSAEKMAEATLEGLLEVQGIGLKTAERIIAAARGEAPADEGSTEE